ncbi:MAG: hypothetical protein ABW049_13885 [Spongiibacteraceae bacterium]
MSHSENSIANILGTGLLAQLDLPQVGTKFPAGYHEAYWFYGYDEQASIGYYFYLVADTGDEILRHEHTFLFLPDGSILAGYSAGSNTRHAIAIGDRLELECDVPFKRWRIRYSADMTLIPADRRIAGVAPGHGSTPVEVALEFDAHTAAWNTEGNWGEPPPALRYHQLGRGRGSIRWGGAKAAIDGYCFRSHSRRQRDMAGWAGHTLANALFADGRAFGIFRMRGSAERPERGRGFVIENGRLFDADVTQHPQLNTPVEHGESFTIVLSGEFGEAVIHGDVVNEVFLSQTASGRHYGVAWDAGAGMLLSEGFVRYRWGNQQTVGVLERSTLIKALSQNDIKSC